MAVTSSSITVTTTATQVAVTDSNYSAGVSVALQNVGSTEVRVGGPSVTATTGFPLAAGSTVTMDLDLRGASGDFPYLIVASGTGTVAVLAAGS